jgi:carbon storage regulator
MQEIGALGSSSSILPRRDVMLVLSRRVGETIVIDNVICVTVVAVQGNKVRLGITAPPHVAVDREEVHQRRQDFSEEIPLCAGAFSEK